MKIYSDFWLNEYPTAQKVVDWIPSTEECSSDVYYKFRVPQNDKEDNWFRNLKLEYFEVRSPINTIYHVSYEREHEYYVVEIEDNINVLREFMENFADAFGLVYRKGEFWLEDMGD